MKRVAILLFVLFLELAVFTSISGREFVSPSAAAVYFQSYFADLFIQAAPVLLLAFGMTIILVTAGIDLSVASMAALVACVMSSFPGDANFWWRAVPAGLAVGLGAGALNGLLVARFDVPPIIATLGTMIFYRGLCFVIMGDLEKSPFLGRSRLFGHRKLCRGRSPDRNSLCLRRTLLLEFCMPPRTPYDWRKSNRGALRWNSS